MEEQELIQTYKHRIRIFLILYIFSEEYSDNTKPNYKKLFQGETKIQKIDFWLRNPDYLSYELLQVAKEDHTKKHEIKHIVKKIFQDNEPILRRAEMKKFFYGAYEDLDDVISFLISVGLVQFSSKRAKDATIRNKKYYITDLAIKKVEKNISELSFLKWYFERCGLIKHFFGNKSGSELKDAQYEIEEYSNASYGNPIEGISPLVKNEFYNLYNETL